MFSFFKKDEVEEIPEEVFVLPIVGISKDKMMRAVKKAGVPEELHSVFEDFIDNGENHPINLTQSQIDSLRSSHMWGVETW